VWVLFRALEWVEGGSDENLSGEPSLRLLLQPWEGGKAAGTFCLSGDCAGDEATSRQALGPALELAAPHLSPLPSFQH
jgi:hypothetical protein